ncbi:MAG: hypothetical protein CTY12_01055 [Methylotenera sp.]|nr:MAG: hypothetical protein CTY12_01055 [Methylotenera sp.]
MTMTIATKNTLLNLAIASALMLTACSNTNKLIMPDGAHRVPINQAHIANKLPAKQDTASKLLEVTEKSESQKLELVQLHIRVDALEKEWDNYKLQLQEKATFSPTPASVKTNPVLIEANLLGSILFSFNQAVLRKSGKVELNELAKSIQLLDEVETIEIIGHTDRLGKDTANEALASKRAKAVRDYLQSQAKLQHFHFEVQSRGGLIPSGKTEHCVDAMAHNDLIECLSPDRRVEIRVYGRSRG